MLCNHSYYSLRFGTVEPEALLSMAMEGGYEHLVLTDINSTAGIIELFRLAEKKTIHVVAGIDFCNGIERKYIGIAKNENGFYELNHHLSEHLNNKKGFKDVAPHFKNAWIIYPFSSWRHEQKLSDNERIGITTRDFIKLQNSPLKNTPEKLVALHPSTFRNKRDYNTHRLLRAIDNNTLLSKLPSTKQAHEEEKFLTFTQLTELYSEYLFLIDNSKQLLSECRLEFDFHKRESQNKKYYFNSEKEDLEKLKSLCEEGILYRYPQASEKVRKRLETEIEVIQQQGFIAYFLINWDIINYAQSKGYMHVGRGSGANSLVAYLLRITNVDPIELDLYFERFINAFRKSPPDFDIDFSWCDRDDIIHYIFNRFDNVVLLGAFNTFQFQGAVRELGRVFGLPKSEIDFLSTGKFSFERLDSIQQLVIKYAEYINNFPNYISIHSSGILVTEKPIHCYGATFVPPKGFPTTQFDMYQAEDISINKLDILSQRGLEKIKETVQLVKENHHKEIDIHDVQRFKNDPTCNALLTQGKTIGCFYIESPAMRMLLTKLQTHCYTGLVAASSVIRPGVSSSGMMAEYIKRERHPECRQNGPQLLLELMPETHGVMVYQEDVIKVAHFFAGLNLGEADVLRRGMSGKYRGREEFQKAKQKFIDGAIGKGHHEKLVRQVWSQVESFAGYAFAKGHSASYAVESYQCLYLKVNYPLEYMTATINNHGGFYSTETYIHEARMSGAIIVPPCVNTSLHHAILKEKQITLGLEAIKNLDFKTQAEILRARGAKAFQSLDDFLKRVDITLESCLLLARVGALRFTGFSKKALMWQLHIRLSKTKTTLTHPTLFQTESREVFLPPLTTHKIEDAYDELELLGFPLCSPFEMLDEQIINEVLSRDFAHHLYSKTGQIITTVGYKITTKRIRTSRGELMYFGSFIDREGRVMDTTHFPVIAQKYPFSGWGLFLIQGKVVEDFGAFSIDVQFIRRMRIQSDPRHTDVIKKAV